MQEKFSQPLQISRECDKVPEALKIH